ncbi:MAG TPA: GerMN domain-containing protein [Candidatus Microbacterium pullistercoris]|nr:GerMN domain-containing protein [Candidatus Microbacterium pullistercoris]
MSMRRTRRIGAAVVAALALCLAACSGLPTEGSFQPGLSTEERSSEARWQFSPDGPATGAEPAAIVLGFLDAGESPLDDWKVAREFLAPAAQATWDPNERITVDSVNDRAVGDFEAETDGDGGTVTARITPTATVDETGAYRLASDNVRSLDFELEQVDGEWRISSAPDGVVVQSGSFTSIFAPQALYFSSFDDRLVPDVRWFADSPTRVERIVTQLVETGPSPWLENAVFTAFEGIDVEQVTVGETSATVELSRAAAEASPEQRARMQTQLSRTLNIVDVRMTVDGSRITAPDDRIVSTEPDPRAMALAETDDGVAFGYFTNGEITPIPGLSDVIVEQFAPDGAADDPATSIVVSPDLMTAIVQTESGRMWWVDGEDGSYDVFNYEEEWTAPSLDAFGYVWSAHLDETGLFQTWDDERDPRELNGLSQLTEVSAIQVSRDGARIAVTGRADNQPVLVVAGVRRDGDARPVGLSAPQDVYPLPGDAQAVAWVSDTTVAAMVISDGRTVIREQQVGARGARLTPSFVAEDITYGNPESSERLLADDGSLYIRNTTSWQQAGGGVLVLATQTGAPPMTDTAP